MVLCSVIVPAHGSLRELTRALQLLDDQTTDDYEIIVVTRGNPETTARIASLPFYHPCRLFDCPPKLPVPNVGARFARGDLLIFLGADCFVGKHFVAGYADAFEPETLLLGPIHQVDEQDWTRVIRTDPRSIFADDFHLPSAGWTEVCRAKQGLFRAANLAVPRRAFLELGGFDERLPDSVTPDADFGWRWLQRGLRVRPLANLVRRIGTSRADDFTPHTGPCVIYGGLNYWEDKRKWSGLMDLRVGTAPPVPARPTAAPAGSKTAHLVWTDPRLYEDRLNRSAAALVALARTIERSELPEGRDFLTVYSRVVAADPAAFTRIWSEPLAYAWVHLAYDLVAHRLQERPLSDMANDYVQARTATDPRPAWQQHLDQFKGFALGVAIQAGDQCRFEVPFRPVLPFAIPGTPWTLESTAPLEINGMTNGQIDLTLAGRTNRADLNGPEPVRFPDWSLVRWPVVEHDGLTVRLQPAGLNLPGMNALGPVLGIDRESQVRHVEVLKRALAILTAAGSEVDFVQFREVLRLIVFKPYEFGNNASFTELPGAIILSRIANPWLLADYLVHEFHHHRLFFLEDLGQFFTDRQANAGRDARYYSPWRADPRPLKGTLHALYVSIAVLRFWLAAHAGRDLTRADRDFARERIQRIALQIAIGTDLLQRHACFSPFGEQLFAQLRTDVAALQDQVYRLRLPADVPSIAVSDSGSYMTGKEKVTVRNSVREHIRRYDVQGHCAELALEDGLARIAE